MYKEIKIGDKVIPMVANGATPMRYKLLFHKDLLVELQSSQDETSKILDSIPELAFIMAKSAEAKEGKANMSLLNQESFLERLEQFGPMDLALAADEIVNLYVGNTLTSSERKKKVKTK
jgi:hypothetical protein